MHRESWMDVIRVIDWSLILHGVMAPHMGSPIGPHVGLTCPYPWHYVFFLCVYDFDVQKLSTLQIIDNR
jgi:hypothetical protein